jgi:hypothetical protein
MMTASTRASRSSRCSLHDKSMVTAGAWRQFIAYVVLCTANRARAWQACSCAGCLAYLRSSTIVSGLESTIQCSGMLAWGAQARQGRAQAVHQRYGNAGSTAAPVVAAQVPTIRLASMARRCATLQTGHACMVGPGQLAAHPTTAQAPGISRLAARGHAASSSPSPAQVLPSRLLTLMWPTSPYERATSSFTPLALQISSSLISSASRICRGHRQGHEAHARDMPTDCGQLSSCADAVAFCRAVMLACCGRA